MRINCQTILCCTPVKSCRYHVKPQVIEHSLFLLFLLWRIRNRLLQMAHLVRNYTGSKSPDGTFSTKILNLDKNVQITVYILIAALQQSLSERFRMLSILLVLVFTASIAVYKFKSCCCCCCCCCSCCCCCCCCDTLQIRTFSYYKEQMAHFSLQVKQI